MKKLNNFWRELIVNPHCTALLGIDSSYCFNITPLVQHLEFLTENLLMYCPYRHSWEIFIVLTPGGGALRQNGYCTEYVRDISVPFSNSLFENFGWNFGKIVPLRVVKTSKFRNSIFELWLRYTRHLENLVPPSPGFQFFESVPTLSLFHYQLLKFRVAGMGWMVYNGR